MAITHPTAIRNELADKVVDHIDDGTGAGTVRVHTAAFAALIVEITLADPAFGSAASAVATAASLPKEGTATLTGTNTAAVFEAADSDDNRVFEGTVTVSGGGGDMELSSISIAKDDVIRINTFTYTAPP